MKYFLKRFFTKNVGWKILSLIVAALFWIVVINIIDPSTKRTFEDIPVDILNESAITSSNQVYEVVSGDKVDVTITSKRSLVERLSAKDFTATADLADMSSVNAVSISVKLNKNPNNLSYELDWGNTMLKVKLEQRVSEKFKVQVDEEGELGDGYVLGDVVVKPNIIEVSGGESKIKKIDHIGVTVALDGQTSEFSTKAKPVAYDSGGDAIDGTKLTFSETELKVRVGVRRTMLVPVEVTTVGVPADGYHLIQTDRQPESIKVSASDTSLLTDDLVIKLEVDIEGATADVEKEIDISNYLGEGYVIEDSTTVVSVRCEIGRSGSRTLYITPADIEVKNLPDGHIVAFANPDERYTIELAGSDDALKEVKLKDLEANIDIDGLGDGTHTLVVNFTLPTGVRLVSPVTVEIVMTKPETETTEEPEETEEPVDTDEEETTE